jgi:lysophospholipase L1-like esterase
MQTPRWPLAFLLFSSLAAAAPGQLTVYDGRPAAGMHVTVADYGQQQEMQGAELALPKPQNAQAGYKVGAKTEGKAVTFNWNDTWFAGMRVEGKPVDLRPYLRQGVLAFDLKVNQLAKGGFNVKVECGDNCERKVPFVLEGRALEGKGWQKLAVPVSCFVHDGDDFSKVARPFALDATASGDVSVANIRYLKKGKANVSCPDYKTISVTPGMLNEAWSIAWWLPRHEAKLAEIKRRQAAGERTDLVFIGDSITEGWEKGGAKVFEQNYKQYNALALGFGGDRTENVLWRLLHGEVDGISPKVAVLMFGTNNTGHRAEDPARTAAGIKRNIEELRRRLPDTKILLLAVFPRDDAKSRSRQINEGINALIAGYADNKNVYFLDINQAFLDKDGQLPRDVMPDLLHPNEKGYEIWAREMAPTLQKLMN